MERPFGTMANGGQARLIALTNEHLEVRVADRGATLVSVLVPDRRGERADVVLGFDDIADYESPGNPYLGATVGRIANRIAGGVFELDGQRYELVRNEGGNHLHGGGPNAFDKVVWRIEELSADAVTFAHVSPAGDEGYPGRVAATVSYRLVDDALHLTYRARTDAPTPLNLTNHAYYNLRGAGSGDVLDHELEVMADFYTPTDDTLIPTGEIVEVTGTPLDLRVATSLRKHIDELSATPAGGYDHNLVVRGEAGQMRSAARLYEPETGRVLELSTDQPGLQVYSGNGIEVLTGKGGDVYRQFGGICLESQHFPDAVHHEAFPSSIVTPDADYLHRTILRFTVDDDAG